MNPFRFAFTLTGLCVAILPATAQSARIPVAAANQLQAAINANRGKVVVVNFWATWCGPCVEEFPDLVRLYNAHKAEGLNLLSVSVDFDKKREQKVADFLKEKKATFPAFLKPMGDDEKYVKSIDADWQGEVPVTYLIDRSGRVRFKTSARIDTARFEAQIKKLLAEKPGAKPTPKRGRGVLGTVEKA